MNSGDILGDTIGRIMEYESGEMSPEDQVNFFADLIRTGLAWRLQGSYGRAAACLIEGGFIDQDGNVLLYPEEL